ncbi:flagellar assembly protein FliW [Metabacillus fastidiosus]|uniref:Flagellar assembly factor FliW n=1 Tax=Metabacillus fastidiosus TaxID=1458 RepID=A0ABU6P058_9BACI|nr:flagellar assembly protein FliW [Metabacillus fastidiosus]MED4402758.1 flagellar assembly protein FliW [Metabacillus fastidiosus]MED4461185.1 flagellar assembly protein FliW [Metabacillus fastidiosus]
MMIQTKYHGEISIEENEILKFEQGIPGFNDEKDFILIPLEQGSPFLILQSMQTAELGFVVVNPFQFTADYEFDLSESDKEILEIKSEKDVEVYTILTVKERFEETTANLQAPLIVNRNQNKAKQIILNEQKYSIKHNLFAQTQLK